MTIQELGRLAKAAGRRMARLDTRTKNEALLAIGASLEAARAEILAANGEDMEAARAGGMGEVMLDRLKLDDRRIDAMITGLRDVAALADPVGSVVSGGVRPNGLNITVERVPMGVIGIIFESRPNVTVDAAALCLKAGSAVILRGGSDAIRSNTALTAAMRRALEPFGLADAVALVEDTSHETVRELMRMRDCLDLLIPRGGAGLIRSVVENASVPVIETGVGNCHIYVDASADLEMAADIVHNAKCSRPSVCNAAESLVVARSVAERFLPMAAARLDDRAVELRCCPESLAILGARGVAAEDADFYTEFLDYIMSVKVVEDVEEAIAFVNEHSTHHSDAIITADYAAAEQFLRQVDSAAVYVNASTRFTDGSELGLGAEIGISTQKLHARGPMGLEALTTTKFVVRGSGQIR